MENPLHLSWFDLSIRLILTIIAGAALGINRGVQGQAAGFRTTILVGLAACVAMIQANLLLSTDGKTGSSFAAMDVLRLPLGILTGIGFIGGGCILKKGDLISGVTTAATIWTITIIGLCFGGGQLILGLAASTCSIFILWILKWLDIRIPRNRRARVLIVTDEDLPMPNLNEFIKPYGYHDYFLNQSIKDKIKYIEFEVHWLKSDREFAPLNLLKLLEKHFTVKSFELTAERISHWI